MQKYDQYKEERAPIHVSDKLNIDIFFYSNSFYCTHRLHTFPTLGPRGTNFLKDDLIQNILDALQIFLKWKRGSQMIFCDKIFPTKNAKETLEIFDWEAVTFIPKSHNKHHLKTNSSILTIFIPLWMKL